MDHSNQQIKRSLYSIRPPYLCHLSEDGLCVTGRTVFSQSQTNENPILTVTDKPSTLVLHTQLTQSLSNDANC